jgi:hypothetical protein
MKEHDVEQGSEKWMRLRRGIPTASQFGRIISDVTGRKKPAARDYLCELVYERVTDKFYRKDLSGIDDVQRGIRLESVAVAKFEEIMGLQTRKCGSITNDEETFGASPDRVVVGRNEAVEVKCPRGPKHIRYLAYRLETDYRAQIQGQILLGGYAGVHFVSYNEEFAFYAEYVKPEQRFIADLAAALAEFTVELDRVTNYVRQRGVFPRNDVLPTFPLEDEEDAMG